MTRILFVYHATNVGGGSYCLLNLLKAIDRMAFEPVVLLPGWGPLCDEIDKLGIKQVFFPKLKLYPYNKSLWSIKVLRRLLSVNRCQKGFAGILSQVKPDIVYFNTMMLFPYLQTAKEQGFKTVLHVREHWPLDEHKKQLERARRLVYAYADKLIAINRYSASIFPQKEATIVYDWIDMEARRGGPSLKEVLGEDPSGKKVYLFTGGIAPIKGTIEVLRAFSTAIVGSDRRLLAMGVNPQMQWDGFRGSIKKMLSKIGFKTYVERVVEICNNDKRIICIPAAYNITDLMESVDGYVSCFTIPHANLALAESIILGVSPIAACTEESLEYSGNGKWAYLYEFGNYDSFCNTWVQFDMGKSVTDMDLTQGSLTIRKKFSPIINAEIFNSLLKDLAINIEINKTNKQSN